MVPGYVQKLQILARRVVKHILAHLVCHLTVIEAEDFKLGVLVDHAHNAVGHLLWQLVVAEVESVEVLDQTDSLYHIL